MKLNIPGIKDFKLWINAIMPHTCGRVFEEQKGKWSFSLDGAIRLIQVPALLFMFASIAVGVVITIATTLDAPFLIIPIVSQVMLNCVLAFGLILVKFVIEQYVLKFLSGIFGGKGSINDQTYLLGLVTAGTLLLMTIVGITVVGILLFPIILLWYLYLMYKILKRVHNMSTINTAIVVIINAIIWIMALAVFVGVMTVIGFGISAIVDEIF